MIEYLLSDSNELQHNFLEYKDWIYDSSIDLSTSFLFSSLSFSVSIERFIVVFIFLGLDDFFTTDFIECDSEITDEQETRVEVFISKAFT